MNRNRNFASSVINNTVFLTTLLPIAYMGMMLMMIVMEAMEEGALAELPIAFLLGFIGFVIAVLIGLVTFILETVMACKARKNSVAYAQKGRGLAITTLVFQFVTLLGVIFVAVGGNAFVTLMAANSEDQALMFAIPGLYPCIVAAVTYFVSIALKLWGIIGCRKKAEVVEATAVEAPATEEAN